MKRLLTLLCVLLGACGPSADITPERASERNVTRFERYVKEGYTLRELYQVPLGENDDSLLEPDGVVVAGLIDGPNATARVVALYFGPGQGGRVVTFEGARFLNVGRISRTTGDFESSRALARFVMKQR